ncbi:MAG: hypothetical protein HOZ81_15225 [Streptomyces sp.]|nr:hypothetical protein [Streptomyces sp.]NUT24484.1 hypothetical protein [Streptomyces sp.]
MPSLMFAALAGLSSFLFLARVRRDPRRFGNGILLGLTFLLLFLPLLAQVAQGSAPATLVAAVTLVVLLCALSVIALALFLIANGVERVRKEGRRPANLLPSRRLQLAPVCG